MDKSTEQESGRIAEVQALQAEDGTFELVVSDSASHPVVSEEAARRHGEAQAPDAPVAAATGVGMKRAGLILLLVALVGGGLIFALSGSDEPEAESARPARAANDGFQPYAGGAGAAGTARPAQAEALDRMKAAAAAEEAGARFAEPRPEPIPLRSMAQPDEQEEPLDDSAWELNEAELLEEARAVELAEQAAEAQGEDEADFEQEEPAAQQPEEEAQQPLEMKSRGDIKLGNQRLLSPDVRRSSPIKLDRSQVRPARTRPPLRGLRGLQRREETEPAPAPDDEGAWEESEEYDEDRVPEFGRD